MRIVKKVKPASEVGWHLDERAAEEITVERRVRVREPEPSVFTTRLTKRMAKIDDRLLAIARGEIDPEEDAPPSTGPNEPDDPFGGLIPVPDDEGFIEVDEGWLDHDKEPEPFPSCPPET